MPHPHSNSNHSNSALKNIKRFTRKHLPTIHGMWHTKVDLHLFKIIFIGLVVIGIFVGIVILATSFSQVAQEKKTTESQAFFENSIVTELEEQTAETAGYVYESFLIDENSEDSDFVGTEIISQYCAFNPENPSDRSTCTQTNIQEPPLPSPASGIGGIILQNTDGTQLYRLFAIVNAGTERIYLDCPLDSTGRIDCSSSSWIDEQPDVFGKIRAPGEGGAEEVSSNFSTYGIFAVPRDDTTGVQIIWESLLDANYSSSKSFFRTCTYAFDSFTCGDSWSFVQQSGSTAPIKYGAFSYRDSTRSMSLYQQLLLPEEENQQVYRVCSVEDDGTGIHMPIWTGCTWNNMPVSRIQGVDNSQAYQYVDYALTYTHVTPTLGDETEKETSVSVQGLSNEQIEEYLTYIPNEDIVVDALVLGSNRDNSSVFGSWQLEPEAITTNTEMLEEMKTQGYQTIAFAHGYGPKATDEYYQEIASYGFDHIVIDEMYLAFCGSRPGGEIPKKGDTCVDEDAVGTRVIQRFTQIKNIVDDYSPNPDTEISIVEPGIDMLRKFLELGGGNVVDYIGGEDYGGEYGCQDVKMNDVIQLGNQYNVKTYQWVEGIENGVAYIGNVDLVVFADPNFEWGGYPCRNARYIQEGNNYYEDMTSRLRQLSAE